MSCKPNTHNLPDGWEWKRLGNICKVNQGLQIPIEERLKIPSPNSLKYITVQYLNNGKDVEYIAYPSKNVCCEVEDILMTRTGNTGLVVTGVTGVFHNNFFKINYDRNSVDKKFLIEYLTTKATQHTILIKAGTSTIPDLNHKDFYSIPFPLPPLPQQRKIAAILSTWDDVIQTADQLLKAKQERKRGIMQHLLTGQKRLPGFSGEWREVKLKEICSRLTRRNGEGNTNVLTISAQLGLISQRDFFKKSVASEEVKNYFLLKRGEFAYNKSYSTGYPYGAIKRLEYYEKGIVSPLYICLSVAKGDSDFFAHLFEFGALNHGIYRIAQEGARNHGLLNISAEDFFQMPIQIPEQDEQQAIATVLNVAEEEIQLVKAEVKALKQQKQGLMQQLLTGQRLVTVDEQEHQYGLLQSTPL